eukprot:c24697_g3_i1 orf=2-196(-)
MLSVSQAMLQAEVGPVQGFAIFYGCISQLPVYTSYRSWSSRARPTFFGSISQEKRGAHLRAFGSK